MLHACHVQQLLAVLTMHARITQSHMTQQQTNVQHVHTWISGQLHHSCQEFCHAAPLVRHLLAVPCCLSVIASAILRLRQAFKRLVTRPIARSVGLAGLPLPARSVLGSPSAYASPDGMPPSCASSGVPSADCAVLISGQSP